MSHVLVTGGTGALGPSIVEAFLAAGDRVRVMARHMPPAGFFDASVEMIVGDVTDDVAVQRAVENVDVVVHLAALLHILKPAASLHDAYDRTNRQGTELIVARALGAGVRRIVYCSTIAVYGTADGALLTETTVPRPNTSYGKSKLAAEEVVIRAGGTVLRLAAVYGGRVKGNYQRLIRALARGWFIPLGNGENHRALVYDKDVGFAAVLAATHALAAGEVFNISDGVSPTMNEIIGSICSALGRPSPTLRIPMAPVQSIVSAVDAIASPLHIRLPVSSATLHKYIENIRIDSSKARQVLGFSPRYDPDSGWRAAVSEMRSAGLLRI